MIPLSLEQELNMSNDKIQFKKTYVDFINLKNRILQTKFNTSSHSEKFDQELADCLIRLKHMLHEALITGQK